MSDNPNPRLLHDASWAATESIVDLLAVADDRRPELHRAVYERVRLAIEAYLLFLGRERRRRLAAAPPSDN